MDLVCGQCFLKGQVVRPDRCSSASQEDRQETQMYPRNGAVGGCYMFSSSWWQLTSLLLARARTWGNLGPLKPKQQLGWAAGRGVNGLRLGKQVVVKLMMAVLS